MWLFGSLVQGEVREGSDLDLLVVMDMSLPFAERLVRFYRGLKLGVATNLFIYTPEEMVGLRARTLLVCVALQEGRHL